MLYDLRLFREPHRFSDKTSQLTRVEVLKTAAFLQQVPQ